MLFVVDVRKSLVVDWIFCLVVYTDCGWICYDVYGGLVMKFVEGSGVMSTGAILERVIGSDWGYMASGGYVYWLCDKGLRAYYDVPQTATELRVVVQQCATSCTCAVELCWLRGAATVNGELVMLSLALEDFLAGFDRNPLFVEIEYR